ncbi:50S ribosomal protein L13 [Candidatus Woesearchaeota archaeon]|nr:50S ribosomal protein L13 [Candidatus Woesearchaeota archaeon]
MTENHIVINAEGIILGRLCSYVAKKALLGYTVDVVNVEKAIVTGDKDVVLAKYKRFSRMGGPSFGPFIGRSSRELFKRSLKRMLPHKIARGVQAFARVKAYKGLPLRYKDLKLETLLNSNVSKLPNTKYIKLERVTEFLGGK